MLVLKTSMSIRVATCRCQNPKKSAKKASALSGLNNIKSWQCGLKTTHTTVSVLMKASVKNQKNKYKTAILVCVPHWCPVYRNTFGKVLIFWGEEVRAARGILPDPDICTNLPFFQFSSHLIWWIFSKVCTSSWTCPDICTNSPSL